MLTIYRASAGSGKTFLLTQTYLRMLFREGTSFDNILAVTFTNKATEEMKGRILQQLFRLHVDPKSSPYIGVLCDEFALTSAQVQVRAGALLRRILHNYADYNVSTIDRFFQQVVRAFTREIGLQGGYDIELDEKRIRTEAVDRLIASLGAEEQRGLLEWLAKLIDFKVRDGKQWDIHKEIIELSGEITKETYKEYASELQQFTKDAGAMNAYNDALAAVCRAFEEKLIGLSKQALAVMEAHGLNPTDFAKKGQSPMKNFTSWANGEKLKDMPKPTFFALANGTEKGWATNSKAEAALRQKILACADGGLLQLVRETVDFFNEKYTDYLTACETLRYTFFVGILADVDRSLREYTSEHNLMLISDSTKLLNQIIDGSDTPFLYEKIGVQIKHFMLDEFQDTSGMQWKNFRPLVEHSLGCGNDNLIVGDVKQSIYRWRNSEWMLLHRKLREQFLPSERRDNVLDTNWRSRYNIVAFNNTFFSQASVMLQAKYNTDAVGYIAEEDSRTRLIREAYADICQQVPDKAGYEAGYVRVEYLTNNETSWNDQALDRLTQTIIELQDKGYALRDIAILTRKTSEGSDVAKHLLQVKASGQYPGYRFDVISNEALFVGQSLPVATILNFMRYLHDPSSDLHRATAFYHLSTNTDGRTPKEAINAYFDCSRRGEDPFTDAMRQEIARLRAMPLFEMTEQIIKLVVNTEADYPDLAYVQAFQDIVVGFINKENADLSAFLRWWDESGTNQKLSSPDKQDAIRILTIHKSKGLSFKAVIVPFASWDINPSNTDNIIWAPTPKEEPFNRLSIVPLRYGKILEKTHYADAYYQERLHAFIDNLNLAYVAFTRPEEALIVFAQSAKEPEKLTNIGMVLQSTMTWSADASIEDYPSMSLKAYYTESPTSTDADSPQPANVFEVGELLPLKQTDAEQVLPVRLTRYVSEPLNDRLHLRLHGKGYFDDSDKRAYGTQIHEVLSTIRTVADLKEALAQCIRDGVLKSDEAPTLQAKLEQLLADPIAHTWFAPDVEVLRERELILPTQRTLRPDRVIITRDGHVTVIDYKTGQRELRAYRRQVLEYMTCFRQMGYKEVEGYLWYLGKGKIVKVEDEG